MGARAKPQGKQDTQTARKLAQLESSRPKNGVEQEVMREKNKGAKRRCLPQVNNNKWNIYPG